MKKLSRLLIALLFSTGLGWAQGNVFGTAALPSAPVIPGPLTLSNLTAGQAVGTNASKQLVSVPIFYADQFAGADAGAKIAAAIADLPSTGGIVDARGLEGAQTISQDLFAGVAKPLTLLLGASTITMSSIQTITSRQISVIGLGSTQTFINCSYNGPCFSVHITPFNENFSGKISGFWMNGNSGANNVGIEMGDVIGFTLQDLVLASFTGTSGSGLHWINRGSGFMERTKIDNVWLNLNTTGWWVSLVGSPPSSALGNAYNSFTNLYFNIGANQRGFWIDGTGNSIRESIFHAIFNMNSTSATAFEASNSSFMSADFNMRFDGGGGGPGVTTSGGGSIKTCATCGITGWPFNWYGLGYADSTAIADPTVFYAEQLFGNVKIDGDSLSLTSELATLSFCNAPTTGFVGFMIRCSANNLLFELGQDSTHGLLSQWNYNVVPGSASVNILTRGYANPITIDASSLSLQASSGGKVGIGTATPTYTLDINGDARILNGLYTDNVVNSADTQYIFQRSGSGASAGVLLGAALANVKILDTGKVGIGTASPGTALDVAGTITTRGSNAFGANKLSGDSACETAYGITTLALAATTTTGLNCLPANYIVDSITYRVTTTITTAVSFTLGDAGSATRYNSCFYSGGAQSMTAGATGVCIAAPGGYLNTTAAGLLITPNVAPGAGAIRFVVFGHTWTPPTS